MEQILKLNDILSSDSSWRSEISQIIETFLDRMFVRSLIGHPEIICLNTGFMKQLSSIRERIQNGLICQNYFPPIDIIQISYSYVYREQVYENIQISTDDPTFQNIIVIGDSIHNDGRIPIKIMETTNRVTNINNILFIYPDHHTIVSYQHLTRNRYKHPTAAKVRTVDSRIKAYQLNLLEPISWYGENPWDIHKFVFIQFGFKTDIQGIYDRIVGSAIKIMWITNLKLENLFTHDCLSTLYIFLPCYPEILYRHIHGILLGGCRECNNGDYSMIDANATLFYTSLKEPMRLIIEMSNVLLQWIPKEVITFSYIAIFSDSMNRIGRVFNPNHIIGMICCMNHFGGAFRDLIQPMFEIMLMF